MKRYSKDDEINNCVRDLLRNGWTIKQGGKHPKLTSPNGRRLTVPSSPSDGHAARNFIADVRRRLGAINSTTTKENR